MRCKVKPSEENGLKLSHRTFTVFTLLKIFVNAREENVSKVVDCCNTIMVSQDFKQVEN